MHHTEALGKDLYETLDIKAKVLKKQEKAKCKTYCLIADETNSVKLVLWETKLTKFMQGKHTISNIKSWVF